MFRRVIGLGISRGIRPFVFTRRCTRTWINRGDKDFIQEPQTELTSDKTEGFLSENKEKVTGLPLSLISALFSETKSAEVAITSPPPTPKN